ncbi:MAG: glycosyltransferase [Chloroflexi bacterium]|nr:glycosyltransferase [Chloroflexota bacterium]
MKVLLIGVRRPGQVGWHCEQGLRELGHEVEALDIAGYFLFAQRDSPNSFVSAAAAALHKDWLNRMALRRARAFRPDIALVIKGHELRPATLAAIRSATGARLANWNTDNPFNPLNTSRDLIDSIPQYDCYFIWGRYLLPELKRAGARRAEYLPFAYDPALHRPVTLPPEQRAALASAVVFAGSPDPARFPFLWRVADCDLGLWGNHWDRLPAGDPLRPRGRGVAEGEKLAPVLSACQIALNFIRDQNGPAHNMRTFEVPACGAFLLTSRTEEQEAILGDGAAYFESADELREKVEYYLRRPEERQRVARRGWERVTGGANTYRDRMKEVLEAARNQSLV